MLWFVKRVFLWVGVFVTAGVISTVALGNSNVVEALGGVAVDAFGGVLDRFADRVGRSAGEALGGADAPAIAGGAVDPINEGELVDEIVGKPGEVLESVFKEAERTGESVLKEAERTGESVLKEAERTVKKVGDGIADVFGW